MPASALAYYKRLSESRQVEDSALSRWLVWCTTEVALLALWAQRALEPSVIFLSFAGICAGSYLSYVRRHKNNWWIKLVLTAAMAYLLVVFLGEIRSSYYDLRLPLASLFLWLQVLHSFDLPGRKDLLLSVVSSFVLLSLAGAFSLTTGFILYVFLYLVVAVPTLTTLESSRLRDGALVAEAASAAARPRWAELARMTAVACTAIVILGTSASALLPQEFNYVGMLPFSMPHAFLRDSQGGLRNPGYPDLPSHLPASPMPVNPDAYYGIASFLDLRMRGSLSGALLMRVKSTEPAYWRGVAFDLFAGTGWERSTDESTELDSGPQDYFSTVHRETEAQWETRQSIQTFYVEREMPNVIYGAYRPHTVYFPSSTIEQDRFMGLRAPYLLDQGLVYSVISALPAPSAESLFDSPPVPAGGGLDGYLGLDGVSAETRRLADEVVAGLRLAVREGPGTAGLPEGQLPLRAGAPVAAGGGQRRRLLPLRVGGGKLRAFRQRPGGDVPGRRHPLAAGDGLRHRRFQPLHGAVRGQGQRRPRLGGALLPGRRLVPLRGHPGVLRARRGLRGPLLQHAGDPGVAGRAPGRPGPPLDEGGAGRRRRGGGRLLRGHRLLRLRQPPGGRPDAAGAAAVPHRRPVAPAQAAAPGARGPGRDPPGSGGGRVPLLLVPPGPGGDGAATPRPRPREYLRGFSGELAPGECESLVDVLYRARYSGGEITEYEALDFRARLRGLGERLRGRDA